MRREIQAEGVCRQLQCVAAMHRHSLEKYACSCSPSLVTAGALVTTSHTATHVAIANRKMKRPNGAAAAGVGAESAAPTVRAMPTTGAAITAVLTAMAPPACHSIVSCVDASERLCTLRETCDRHNGTHISAPPHKMVHRMSAAYFCASHMHVCVRTRSASL